MMITKNGLDMIDVGGDGTRGHGEGGENGCPTQHHTDPAQRCDHKSGACHGVRSQVAEACASCVAAASRNLAHTTAIGVEATAFHGSLTRIATWSTSVTRLPNRRQRA